MSVPRLLAAALGAALLSGCLDYEITVRNEVDETGGNRRRVEIREGSDEPKPWANLARPAGPYALEETGPDGAVARAALAPGEHASGLRVRVEPDGDSVEGTVATRSDDLILGRLVRYRERIALGVDPGAVRRRLGPLLGELVEAGVAALQRVEPDHDLAPVVRRAREDVIPRVVASALLVQLNLMQLARDHRQRLLAHERVSADAGGDDAERRIRFEYDGVTTEWGPVAADPRIRLVLEEFARYGLVRRADGEPLDSLEDLLDPEAGAWDYEPVVLRELFAAVPDAGEEARARWIARVQEPDEELSRAWDAVVKERWPEGSEAQARLESEAGRTMSALFGGLFTVGFVDSHDLRVQVTLPGTLLYTNGQLGPDGPSWRLDSGDLVLTDPVLVAVSFVPADGQPPDGWSLRALERLRDDLEELDPEARAELATLWTEREDDTAPESLTAPQKQAWTTLLETQMK